MSVGQHGTAQQLIYITPAGGVEYELPLRPGSGIPRTPVDATTQVVTVGDNSRRSDLRTPQVILTDQTGGMGEFEYTEIDGVLTFTDSTCETRFPSAISLPPARTQLTGTVFSGSPVPPVFIEHIGEGTVKVLAWAMLTGTTPNYYDTAAGGSWNNLAGLTNLTGFCRFGGVYVLTRSNGVNPTYTSTDGITWTARPRAKLHYGCCAHDNKFFTFNTTDRTLDWNTDPTSATFTSSSPLKMLPGENVYQLFEWRDRNGKPVVYLLSNFRLFWYNEDEDAFQDFDASWAQSVLSTSFYPRAHVWGRTGDLYVNFYNVVDRSMEATAMHYSGNRETTGPNARAGMLTASRVRLTHMIGAQNWLYAWGDTPYNLGLAGRTMALNPAGGWHTLTTGTTSAPVHGGGYARGLLWTYTTDQKVYEQAVPDVPDQPLLTASGEWSFPTSGTFTHEYAFTDGGTDNMAKLALWVTVVCRDHTTTNKTRGLEANTTLKVEYLRDEDTAWTTLTTLTGALGPSSFPNNIAFNSGNGVQFREIKLRLTLTSSNANNSPMVTSVALAYRREPVVRYAYQCAIDLSDARWGYNPQPQWNNLTAWQLRDLILSWAQPGTLVAFRYGGNTATQTLPSGITVANAKITVGGQEDATRGTGVLSITIEDVSTPANGT
jgi:hypothetical protein